MHCPGNATSKLYDVYHGRTHKVRSVSVLKWVGWKGGARVPPHEGPPRAQTLCPILRKCSMYWCARSGTLPHVLPVVPSLACKVGRTLSSARVLRERRKVKVKIRKFRSALSSAAYCARQPREGSSGESSSTLFGTRLNPRRKVTQEATTAEVG